MLASASRDRGREVGEQSAPVGDAAAARPRRTRPARRAPIRRRSSCSVSTRCLRSVTQSRRWTIRPWPLRNWPTTASPGIGRQQRAYWIATPSTPRSVSAPALRRRGRAAARRAFAVRRASAPARRRTTAACRARCRPGCRAGSCAPYSFASASQRSQVIDFGLDLAASRAPARAAARRAPPTPSAAVPSG